MTTAQKFALPSHSSKTYAAALECIYCGSPDRLTKEHIIPFSAGSRWTIPNASCQACSAITGSFEGEFSRTILGPLRMLYEMPTRRPKDRPTHLPLKVKYATSTDWEIAYVDRSICPFLVGLPLYPLPETLTGISTAGDRGAATSSIWIRGAGFRGDVGAHLQWLCTALGATEVMPIATVHTEPFCLTLAKIAHSFTVAELGVRGFRPFLTPLILHRELSNRAAFIGGGRGDEPPSEHLHELEFANDVIADPEIISVKIRLLGFLGTPTYHVVAGRRLAS